MSYILQLPNGRFISKSPLQFSTELIVNAKVFKHLSKAYAWKEMFSIDCIVAEVTTYGWTRSLALVSGDDDKAAGSFHTSNDGLVRVDIIGIEHETAMAVLFMFDAGLEPIMQWVPKSLIHYQEDDHFYTLTEIADEYNNHERAI